MMRITMISTAALCLCLLVVVPITARADQGGDALAAQCPAFAAWMKAHHKDHPASHATATAKPSDPALRKQLLSMARADQDARNAWIQSGTKPNSPEMKHMMAVDADNLTQLRKILAHGFPTSAMVGRKGVEAAFLLVQHATGDVDLQARVLPQVARLQARGEISGNDFALLTDRVLRMHHKPQRYGTQFMRDAHTHGAMVLQPTEDLAHVDARRARLGLPPLEAYACVLSFEYHIPALLHPPKDAAASPRTP